MSKINIRKRGIYYEYRVEIAPVDGKRQWLSKSGYRTKPEAQEAGVQAYNEYLNAGIPFKSCDLSYSDYLDYWLENYCKNNLRYNTIQTYTLLINKYIKPKIGKFKLSTITSVSLNSYITDVVNEFNHSKSYYKNILKVVKGSFRDACNLYGFIKYNPALTIRLPRMDIEKEEVKHLYTLDEVTKILNRFKGQDAFTCSFLTSCFTGMRTGEVFALTWEDIDLENQIIHIKHSIYDKVKDENGRWYIGTTKTISGTRDVYISSTLLLALKNYKRKQDYLKKIYGKKYIYYHTEEVRNNYGKVIETRIVKNKKGYKYDSNIDLVFVKDNGNYVGTDLIRYPFKIIRNELGFKHCRFYDLRGSYATKILNNGIERREVADILGHKDVSTTENYYISSTSDTRKNATEVFDNLMKSDIIDEIVEYKI